MDTRAYLDKLKEVLESGEQNPDSPRGQFIASVKNAIAKGKPFYQYVDDYLYVVEPDLSDMRMTNGFEM